MKKNRDLGIFLIIVLFFTGILFWQVFLQNKVPFSANLLVSFFNPWAQEKFTGWEVGIPNKPTGWDDIDIFYPQRSLTTDILNKGMIPLWNPYNYSGNYQLGLSETAVFYPLFSLFFFLPQIDAWVILVIIQPVLAGIGMYLFLRRLVFYTRSAFLGALVFAFSGLLIVRSVEGLSVGHTLIWFPFALWGVESFFKTKRFAFILVTAAAFSLSLLAGWFQYTFYILIFSLSYIFFKFFILLKENKNKKTIKAYWLIFLPFLLFPLLTLFHLFPVLQTLSDSPRLAEEGRIFITQHLMPFMHVFTFLFPDLWGNPAVYNYFGRSDYKESIVFIGILPLLFILFAFIGRKDKKETAFFMYASLITLILGIDNPLSRIFLNLPIPIVSTFLPDRIFLITVFSLSVLTAFGSECLLKINKNLILNIKKYFIFIWAIVLGMFLLLSFQLAVYKIAQAQFPYLAGYFITDVKNALSILTLASDYSQALIQLRNTLIPVIILFLTTVSFYIFRKNYAAKLFFPVIILILFFQQYYFAQKYIPFSNRQFVYPSHPIFGYLKDNAGLNRFLSVGKGHINSNIPLYFNLFSPEGGSSMYIKRYGEFMRYVKLGDFGMPDKVGIEINPPIEDVFLLDDSRFNRFLQIDGIKYIIVDKKSLNASKIIPDEKSFSLVWSNNNWQIYEYKNVLPRVFITNSYEVITDRKKVLERLFDKNFNPRTIILEDYPVFKPGEVKNIGFVNGINYTPNEIKINLTVTEPALVFVSDNYTKGFKVFVDGKEGKIIRADYTFRAVPVEKGRHEVIMAYDDKNVFIGFLIAGITLVIATILIFIGLKLKKINF